MAIENSHRRLQEIVAIWLLKQSIYDICSWELSWNDGFVDAIGLTSPLKSNGRITAIEVKRTRADLLADLNRKKLLKYEEGATHCYIAATKEALGITKDIDKKKAIEILTSIGLPKYWGILLLPTRGSASPIVLRTAKQFGKLIPNIQLELTVRISQSFAHRILNKNSPIEE